MRNIIIASACVTLFVGCGTVQPPEVPPQPEPVPAETVPWAGEFTPDPVLVLYKFEFSDGTKLVFRENHQRDIWGYYPNGGFGEIADSDGNRRYVDINKIVRHGGLHTAKTPVTTLDHGGRMYWMADREDQKDTKRVTIFEDGWNPLVEGAVLATQTDLGIYGNLMKCSVKIEGQK